MWGPKALIPQVVWKCFSLNGNVATFCLVGGQFLSISSPQIRTRIWTSVNHCLLPYHREIGDPSTQTSTNVKPYHFCSHPLRLGGMSGGTTESSPASPLPRLGLGQRYIMFTLEMRESCWYVNPHALKMSNFVKQRRSFFFATCLLGGGFKALHWTFWWDSHTLGSSSPIGPWAIKGKGALIVWCEDWSFSTANVWLQTFKDVSWATGCGDLQAWMLSYVPLWFGNAECSCLWTVVVSPCWCTEGIRCF